MIQSIQINSGKLQELFPNIKEINFTDKITYILGKNGCGKSLLVKTISEHCMIDDVGSSNIINYDKKRYKEISDITVNWDKNPVMFINHNYLFDWYTNMSYEMTTGARIPELKPYMRYMKGYQSSGQLILDIVMQLKGLHLKQLHEGYPHYWDNTYSRSKYPRLEDLQKIVVTKPTLILDEIDSNLDLWNQKDFHEEILPQIAENFQVIVISHSYYAHTSKENKIYLSEKIEF